MALLICLECVWECICATELLMGLCSDGCGHVVFSGKCWCY